MGLLPVFKVNVCLIFFLSSQYVFRSSNQSASGMSAGTSHIRAKATTISQPLHGTTNVLVTKKELEHVTGS